MAGSRLAGAIGLPPTGVTGVGMATARRRGGLSLGMALVGLTVATTVVVAAAMIGVSLNQLGRQPSRYGVRWDATIDWNGTDGRTLVAAAQQAPGVAQAGVIWEQDGRVNQQSVNLVALSAVKGSQASAWTSVVSGRAPETDDETALGGKTMRALHAHIGGTVSVQVVDAVAPRRLKVVGQVEFNDGTKLDAGDGALVPLAMLESSARYDFDALAIRIQPGADLSKALEPIVQAGGLPRLPSPPPSVRNLERIRWLPWSLAITVLVLAAAALAHALVLSVRANRGDLAVVRSLGFTPRQVARAARWEAATLAATAIVVGVPLGLLIGSWGWAELMRQNGLAAPVAVPAMALVVIPLTVLAAALLLSLWPGHRAARVRLAMALRAE